MKTLKNILTEAISAKQMLALPTAELVDLINKRTRRAWSITGPQRNKLEGEIKTMLSTVAMRPDCPPDIQKRAAQAKQPMRPASDDPYKDSMY